MNPFFEITVGGGGQYDPAIGATVVDIPILAGIGGYLEKRNVGKLSGSAYSVLSSGGFSVTTPFASGEVYFFVPNYFASNTVAGSYSNGFNYSRVMSALIPRIGWRQEGNLVDSSNQITLSGRCFNDGSFHPVVTVKNVNDVYGAAAFTVPALNAELLQIKKSAIISALTTVFNKPEVVEKHLLFNRAENNDTEIPNSGRFVGVRFKVAGDKYALKVNSLQLYFTAEQTFNLYIFHDSQTAPVWTQSVTTAANESVSVPFSSDLILNYLGANFSSGYFYLGYFQDDIGSAKAIDEQKCKEKTYCVGVDFFHADKIGSSFNKKQVSTSSQTFGINADITVFRDHTESVVRNAYLFDNAIGLQVAYTVIRNIVYSNRRNQTERTQKEASDSVALSYEMEGAIPAMGVAKTSGLQSKINAEFDRIRKAFFPKQKSQVVTTC